jgi:predicted nuclease with TOPRIM domain
MTVAVKSFFNWVIMRRYDWRNLEKENDRLSNAVKVRDEQIERLNKRLDGIKNGERCKDKHCHACKNACEVKSAYYVSAMGITEQTECICLLDATCPDFERKEE